MKIIISDTDETHANLVKQCVLLGFGEGLDESEVVIYDLGTSLEDAILFAEGEGATLVVRSTPGAANLLDLAELYYVNGDYILVCMPAGSNSPGEIFTADIPQAMCITGAGDVNNETADNVEFIAPDPITLEPDLSSFSNGYIAGQLLKIKEARDCNWEEARICARQTGSENGLWHEINGFGLINIAAAIAYNPDTDTKRISIDNLYYRITAD